MPLRSSRARCWCVALLLPILTATASLAETIRVTQVQGSIHGFLLLRSEAGKVIATGDLVNVARGQTVHSHLVFHFHDGSIDDETTVFRQGTNLQVISDHHIQRGPSFPQPIDISLNTRTGEVTTRSHKDGREVVDTQHIDMPADLANGLLPAILENWPAHATEVKVGYIAGDPKPRLVAVSIKPVGQDRFDIDGQKRSALVYNLHIELGGVAGVVAPLIGKQPGDMQIWVADGDIRAFLKMEGPLYVKGPVWTMELASPEWPRSPR